VVVGADVVALAVVVVEAGAVGGEVGGDVDGRASL
jgi:hypothetical protein